MKIFRALRRLAKALHSEEDRKYVRYLILEAASNLVYPGLIFSEDGRVWMKDQTFLDYYKRFDPKNFHSADRKYFLRSLLSLVQNLEGETAECGVFEGASSWLICEKFKDSNKTHYLFDSFEGLSMPIQLDGTYWSKGALSSSEEVVRNNLSPFSQQLEIHKGWIPEKFNRVAHKQFCFVHIDVDLYQPTLDSISFFYPKLVRGGIILCDDYGFDSCPGAKKAFDEYMKGRVEKIVHVPTGQGFVIKQ